MNLKTWWGLIRETFQDWSEDKAPRLAAALSYYTIFSIAPLLVIVIGIAGIFLGQAEVRNSILAQMEGLMGTTGSSFIGDMIDNAGRPGAGIVATVVGVVTLLFGASGVIGQLQDAMNTIWEVQPKPGLGIIGTIKKRFFTFSVVLGTGFMLLVLLVLSAGLTALNTYFQGLLPGSELFWQVINQVVSVGLVAALFALMFKLLPDVKIQWRSVWIGGLVTSILFNIGKFLIGLYLGRSSVGDVYGAAGSLVIFLLWIYYSAQIFFMGAEFTQVYARHSGHQIQPDKDAVRMTEEDRIQQGIAHRETVTAAVRAQNGEEPARHKEVVVELLPVPEGPLQEKQLRSVLVGMLSMAVLGLGTFVFGLFRAGTGAVRAVKR